MRLSSWLVVQSMVRWMFCSSTQPPVLCAAASAFMAMGSCPWPSATEKYLPASVV